MFRHSTFGKPKGLSRLAGFATHIVGILIIKMGAGKPSRKNIRMLEE